MPWLYNLITLVIVLVFFFIYHRLTANNRSLEKVKKLAERLQGELGDYVATRAEELKHYGIDLDVQQKAAKIALEKLQASQVTLAEKSQAIGAIAERFREYDAVLAKLMDMTSKVDANLAHVHEEATFAEAVNRKLDLSRKGLAAIERELPLLRESFAQDAQKTIDGFKEDILDELQDGLNATEAELNTVKNEAIAALKTAQSARALVNAELEKALESAVQRSTSIEDSAFSTLQASSAEKLSGMKEALDAFKNNWTTETQSMLSGIVTLLGSSMDKAHLAERSLAKTAQEAKISLDQNLAKIEGARASIDQSLDATKTKIEEDFASFGQALEGRRTSFEEGFIAETKSLSTSLAALWDEIESLKTTAYRSTEAKLSGFEDELLKALSGKKSESFKKLDSWLSEMEKTLSGITAEAGARRDSEETKNLQDFRAHFVKVRDELYTQIDRLGREIGSLRESILEQNQEARKMLKEMVPSLEESAKALFDETLAKAGRESSAKGNDSLQS